jgi:hypothetical protein
MSDVLAESPGRRGDLDGEFRRRDADGGNRDGRAPKSRQWLGLKKFASRRPLLKFVELLLWMLDELLLEPGTAAVS